MHAVFMLYSKLKHKLQLYFRRARLTYQRVWSSFLTIIAASLELMDHLFSVQSVNEDHVHLSLHLLLYKKVGML